MICLLAAAGLLSACGGESGEPAATPKGDSATLSEKGEALYQRPYAEMGCEFCHGAGGEGKLNVAPDIRGKSAEDIARALHGDAMSYLYITEEEIEAVAAYLEDMAPQP